MSATNPEPGEVWQEADGHLMRCFPPGVWARFGSNIPIPPTHPSIEYPLRRVFTKFGVPTMDDPIKDALLEDLDLAQRDRDHWRNRAVWLSNHTTSPAERPAPDPDDDDDTVSGFIPPPTQAPGL